MQAILWVTKGVLPKDAGVEIGSSRACVDLVLDIVKAAIMISQLVSWLHRTRARHFLV